MSTANQSAPAARPSDAADEVRILDLAAVLVRQWRLVVGCLVVFVVVGVVAYRLLPKQYNARTVLLPSQETGDTRSQMLLSQVPVGLLGMAGGGAGANQARIAAILKSGSLVDSMVARLAFQQGSEGDRSVREVLGNHTEVRSGEGGAVVISVGSRDPQLAFRIASEFPSLVNALVLRLGAEAATHRQTFLEAQLAGARERLEASEQRLVAFQQSEDAPEVQEQARRTLEAAARLQQQIMEQEIRVAQLRRVATLDNPELRAAVAELSGWRSQLARLTGGGRGGPNDVFVSLSESPELQLAATRLLREFKKDEQIYLSFSESLAEAQVTAKNDLPVVSVLDRPTMPTTPSSYPSILIAAVTALLGLGVGIALAFLREYAANARRNPDNALFFRTWDAFKADFRRSAPRRSKRLAPGPSQSA